MKITSLASVVGSPSLKFFKLYLFSHTHKILSFERQQEFVRERKRPHSAQSNNFICLLKHIRANLQFSNLETSKIRKEVKPLSVPTASSTGPK